VLTHPDNDRASANTQTSSHTAEQDTSVIDYRQYEYTQTRLSGFDLIIAQPQQSHHRINFEISSQLFVT